MTLLTSNEPNDWAERFVEYVNQLPWLWGSRPDWASIPHTDLQVHPLDDRAFAELALSRYKEGFLLRGGSTAGALQLSIPEDLERLDELCCNYPGWSYLCGVDAGAPVFQHFAEYGTTAGSGLLRVATVPFGDFEAGRQ